MEALLLYFGKMILCSAVMFGYYHLALKNRTFHHYNRFYLLSVVVVSVLLPLLEVSYFTIEVNSDIYRLFTKFSSVNQTKTDNNDFIYYRLIIFLFGLASVLILGRFFIGILKIRTFRRRFPKEEIEGISFYQTNLESAPFSFFRDLFWKNSILLNSDLGRQILKHEMVHIEQKHTHDKIFMEITTGIFWINPIFWLIKKEINLIHEYLADNKAVKHMDTKAFAQMLLASHFSGTVIPATSPFLSSNLKKRLKMLQKPKTKFGYAHRILALPIVFSLAFIYMVNAKNKEIEKTNKLVESQVKNDTIKRSVTATLVQVKDGAFDMDEKLKNATDKSLFLVNGEEVSKSDYIKYITENKGDKRIVQSYSSSESNEHLYKEFGVLGPYGEFEKYGVFQVDNVDEMSKNHKKYWKIQDKYAPEWRQYLKDLKKPENRARLDRIMAEKEAKATTKQAEDAKIAAAQAVVDAREAVVAANEAKKIQATAKKEAEIAAKEAKYVQKENSNAIKLAEEAKLEAAKAIIEKENAKREVEQALQEFEKQKNAPWIIKVEAHEKPEETPTVESKISYIAKINYKPNSEFKSFKIKNSDTKFFIDGKEMPYDEVKKLSPQNINSISILKKGVLGKTSDEMRIETKKSN